MLVTAFRVLSNDELDESDLFRPRTITLAVGGAGAPVAMYFYLDHHSICSQRVALIWLVSVNLRIQLW